MMPHKDTIAILLAATTDDVCHTPLPLITLTLRHTLRYYYAETVIVDTPYVYTALLLALATCYWRHAIIDVTLR